MKNNIVLVGFMGSGKTTVGKALAKLSGYDFVDSDLEIERAKNKSITEIFNENGEDYFRRAEAEIINELSSKSGLIIATGGGAVLNTENRNALKKNGFIVYLKVTPETVVSRLKNDTTRPLLAKPNRNEIIEQLINQREPLYQSICNVSICADGDADMLAKNIFALYSDKA